MELSAAVRARFAIAKTFDAEEVVGVDWYGPYDPETATRSGSSTGRKPISFLGKLKGQHHRKMQYVGKSNKGLASWLQKDHHKLCEVPRD